ncbi:MAG TPA: mechanosensitive ion channel family protein [Opitutales bacterium]|jgi:small-conductance mechanosensitive channel/CRP-like cAMP-binding protein|nr:mechanosensitive ion channel family protein [Opitutales bacterium]
MNEGLVLAGAALVYYFVLIGCAQLLRRTHHLQFGRFYHVFAFTAALMGGLAMSGWIPSWHENLVFDLGAVTALFSAYPLTVILNRLLWTRMLADGRRVDAPRLLADATGLIIFLAAALLVWRFVLQQSLPTSLLAGSGVAAFIIGFAMQDLLGNIFAGFALYVSKPFKVGDWLLVDTHHARVLEVAWRSTRLITNDEVVLEVPNSDLVKRPILNFHQPTSRHALRAAIGLHYNVPPARAQAVLRHAASTVPGVLVEPPVDVYVKEFAASSVNYEIKFWIDDHQTMNRTTSEVMSHCWYAVRRAGMEIPFPTITLHQPGPRDPAAEARAAAAAALRAHSIFSFLSVAQVDDLVQHSAVVLFAPAEPLVEQGDEGSSMFLIVQGYVDVRVTREGATKIVTQLGPGDCLGEMSALTGEKRSATVVALVEVEAVEITHAAFSAFVRHNPEVLNRLGELLAQRQQANVQTASGAAATVAPEARESVVRRLRAFFELGD